MGKEWSIESFNITMILYFFYYFSFLRHIAPPDSVSLADAVFKLDDNSRLQIIYCRLLFLGTMSYFPSC